MQVTMAPLLLPRILLKHLKFIHVRRIHLQSKLFKNTAVQTIRNIGIIAHIDAGKTTTTERMLFYSGYTNQLGEVHDGDTVMDYMPQERERGITITSAAISFNWDKHKINLIDTPGHVDFTIEVERCLCVLDGAVTILDASAGVEVQTLTVWNQAEKYKVPSIIYLNKMDKPAANVEACMESIAKKLKTKPLLLHIPIGNGKQFAGVVDILTMEKIEWDRVFQGAKDGRLFSKKKLDPEEDEELWAAAVRQREEIISEIVDLDDALAEKFLSSGFDSLTDSDLCSALRRISISKAASIVLCGSSYKNVAVQLLMDAVVKFLPNPTERKRDFLKYYKDEFCSQVFKIIHDKSRGPLTFLRIFSGSMKNGQGLYNASRGASEKMGRLMIPFADNFLEVPSLSEGNIAVLSGLKESTTGDIILASSFVASKVKAAAKNDNGNVNEGVIAGGIYIPDPVFFCTIEPPSLGAKNQLDHALFCLQREDPSFRVENDDDMGQTILSGMGELHIDIIKERLRIEYGVEAFLGPLQVAYKEAIGKRNVATHILDKSLGGTSQYCKITLEALPNEGYGRFKFVKVIVTKDNELGKIRSDYLKCINNGVQSALNYGPILRFPVLDTQINLLELEVRKGTTALMIGAAASQCVKAVLKNASSKMLEPIMHLVVTVGKGYVGSVINDLSQRRGQILNVEARQDVEVIHAHTPLSEMMGYSTELRRISSGKCTLTMEFDHYEEMGLQDQANAIKRATGFAPF